MRLFSFRLVAATPLLLLLLLLQTVDGFHSQQLQLHLQPFFASSRRIFPEKTSYHQNARASSHVMIHCPDQSTRGLMEEPISSAPSFSLTPRNCRSRIASITATNLGGFVSHESNDIVIHFRDDSCFVAVTGNSASGKSLLLAKTLELICGAKASASLLRPGAASASVKVQIRLAEPHLAAISQAFEKLGLDVSSLTQHHELILERTLHLQTRSNSVLGRPRLKSVCRVNGQVTTLKDMASISQPLLVVVDASAAAAALANEDARLAIIDTGVAPSILETYHFARERYQLCRQKREQMEYELTANGSKLFGGMEVHEKDMELLGHYIAELDALELRIQRFCESLSPGVEDLSHNSVLAGISYGISRTKWNDDVGKDGIFRSALLERLCLLRDNILELDGRIASALLVIDALGSLSTEKSAMTAMERARKHLYDVTAAHSMTPDEKEILPGAAAAERIHDMLNEIETALVDCSKFIEDDEKGLLKGLERERSSCAIGADQIESLICDWSSLARKHGVTSYQLPFCHAQLQQQRDGGTRARELLPMILADEKQALEIYHEAGHNLLLARDHVVKQLEKDVTDRLPSLSMETTNLCIELLQIRSLTDASVSSGANYAESIAFKLWTERSSEMGGDVHDVASSGEKSRFLLALESSLPGCVGAVRRRNLHGGALLPSVPPIAVIYDEIDAHVGGSAANALATMLASQARNCQIVAITHSPPVGALADLHLVVRKSYNIDEFNKGVGPRTVVNVTEVDKSERRLELARMASGDLATSEAQMFAEALIREGVIRRDATKELY